MFHFQSEILLGSTIIDSAEYWVLKPEGTETSTPPPHLFYQTGLQLITIDDMVALAFQEMLVSVHHWHTSLRNGTLIQWILPNSLLITSLLQILSRESRLFIIPLNPVVVILLVLLDILIGEMGEYVQHPNALNVLRWKTTKIQLIQHSHLYVDTKSSPVSNR